MPRLAGHYVSLGYSCIAVWSKGYAPSLSNAASNRREMVGRVNPIIAANTHGTVKRGVVPGVPCMPLLFSSRLTARGADLCPSIRLPFTRRDLFVGLFWKMEVYLSSDKCPREEEERKMFACSGTVLARSPRALPAVNRSRILPRLFLATPRRSCDAEHDEERSPVPTLLFRYPASSCRVNWPAEHWKITGPPEDARGADFLNLDIARSDGNTDSVPTL